MNGLDYNTSTTTDGKKRLSIKWKALGFSYFKQYM